jgi:predicted alpha/beta superfamily hydrolase
MKQKFFGSFILSLVVLALYNPARAQSGTPLPKVEVPGSQVLKFTSTIVGQEYQLYINLPRNYLSDTTKTFPVVYLLDGQYDFPLFAGVYSDHYYDGFLPGLLTVGITWGGPHPNADSLRGRDFTPSHIEQMPQSGNGPKFLEFIKKELIPFISSKYRVTDDRTLVGSSFGGLFTLYALFNDPSLFHRYILTSPSLGWDNNMLRPYETKYEEKGSSTPVRLFMGIGGLEGDVAGFQQFADRLKEKKVKGLEFHTLVLENTGHAGTKPEGFGRGLQWAFERPSLLLAPAVLDRYAGSYLVGTDTVVLSKEEGKLVARVHGEMKIVLEAETEKDFYLKGQYLKVHFKLEDTGKVSGFQLEQFDGGMFVRRVK